MFAKLKQKLSQVVKRFSAQVEEEKREEVERKIESEVKPEKTEEKYETEQLKCPPPHTPETATIKCPPPQPQETATIKPPAPETAISRSEEKVSQKISVPKTPEQRKKPKLFEVELTEKRISRFLEELELLLLENDVAVEPALYICETVRKNLIGKVCKRGEVESVIKDSFRKAILEIFHQCGKVNLEEIIQRAKKEKGYATIVFLGFNGVGKTVTLAKVAALLKNKGYRVLLAAGDTFRAAAIEQLEEHAKKLSVDIVKQHYGSDAAAVIYDARMRAQSKNYDVVLADTAGRSHANVNLMEELRKICRVNQPDLKILVLDSLTGNDVIEQAKKFNSEVGVDGIILTKADVYEKGGAAISAAYAIKKPILFLGVGQGYEDLREFNEEKIVKEILE